MNPELKAKWVEALRSGTYLQAIGTLKDEFGGGYCCLGVLADITGLAIRGNTVLDKDGGSLGYQPICEMISGEPLADLTALWWRNDGKQGFERHSFDQIADYIEANL
jgi:hypothetical protein